MSGIRRMIQLARQGYLSQTIGSIRACHSLAKRVREYTGPCIRVRRSSDNSTFDIGFVNDLCDFDDALGFVGVGNNGYVDIIYDQSGNGFNLVQTVFDRQPLIVSNGSLLFSSSGSPTIRMSGGTSGSKFFKTTQSGVIPVGTAAKTVCYSAQPLQTSQSGARPAFGYGVYAATTSGRKFMIGMARDELRTRFGDVNRGLTGLDLSSQSIVYSVSVADNSTTVDSKHYNNGVEFSDVSIGGGSDYPINTVNAPLELYPNINYPDVGFFEAFVFDKQLSDSEQQQLSIDSLSVFGV